MTGDDEEGARCDGEEGDESNGSCCYRPLPLAECTWKNTFPSIALTLWLLQSMLLLTWVGCTHNCRHALLWWLVVNNLRDAMTRRCGNTLYSHCTVSAVQIAIKYR
jgi:hypothetical protein